MHCTSTFLCLYFSLLTHALYAHIYCAKHVGLILCPNINWTEFMTMLGLAGMRYALCPSWPYVFKGEPSQHATADNGFKEESSFISLPSLHPSTLSSPFFFFCFCSALLYHFIVKVPPLLPQPVPSSLSPLSSSSLTLSIFTLPCYSLMYFLCV